MTKRNVVTLVASVSGKKREIKVLGCIYTKGVGEFAPSESASLDSIRVNSPI